MELARSQMLEMVLRRTTREACDPIHSTGIGPVENGGSDTPLGALSGAVEGIEPRQNLR